MGALLRKLAVPGALGAALIAVFIVVRPQTTADRATATSSSHDRGSTAEDYPGPEPLPQLAGLQPVPETSVLPTLRINVAPADLARLIAQGRARDARYPNRPGGARPVVPAIFRDDDGHRRRAEIRLRGLGAWHHTAAKPSLRLKLHPDDVAPGFRRFDLQRPESYFGHRNWLPNELARELGLLTIPIQHVRLFINDEYRGIYLRNPRLSRRAILARGRMPGVVFKGDNWTQSLWQSAEHWKARGEDEQAMAYFDRLLLLRAGAGESEQAMASYQAHLDLESFTEWSALMTIVGSAHTDQFHNQLLHYAPERGQTEPIPWDVNAYGTSMQANTPVDLANDPFTDALMADPRFIHRRALRMQALMQGPLSAQAQAAKLDALISRLQDDLMADRFLGSLELRYRNSKDLFGVVPAPVTAAAHHRKRFIDWVTRRERTLERYLGNAVVAARATAAGTTEVSVVGHMAVRALLPDGSLQLLYPGRSRRHFACDSEPYQKGVRSVLRQVVPVPEQYELAAAIDTLRFENAVTGTAVTPIDGWPIAREPSRTLRLTEASAGPEAELKLGPGTVELHETLKTAVGQRMVIAPKTRVLLAAGVSIHAFGPLIARGSRDAPIEFYGIDDAAWGSIGVSGAQSAGSRFEHVRMSGGGASTDGRIVFKGMLSVYRSHDLRIANSHFSRNAHGDDAVNLASTSFVMRDTVFSNARADALDLDQTVGRVERVRLVGSGNDGVDLMGGRVYLLDVVALRSGDKGVSVGEAAQVEIEAAALEGNAIGVEVKDDSRVLLRNVTLKDNDIAIHGYRKKTFYRSGGQAVLVDVRISGSRKADHLLEDDTSLTVVSGGLKQGPGVVQSTSLPDQWRTLSDELRTATSDLAVGRPLVTEGVSQPTRKAGQ